MKDLSVTAPEAQTAAALEWQGATYRTILTTAATGGAMSIVDNICPPRSGPPMHVHHAEDEVLVVLSGDLEVVVAGQRSFVSPGQAAFVPRGTEHTFRVASDTPARLLAILTPGGFEGFFAEMARGRFRIPEDMPAVIESATRHHLTFTGPPLMD